MVDATNTVREAFEELMARYPVDSALELGFGEWGARVRSNSSEVLDRLGTYYKGFRNGQAPEPVNVHVFEGDAPPWKAAFSQEPPEPGKSKIKHESCDLTDGRVIRKRETGMQFLIGEDILAAVGQCSSNLTQVINFINTRYMDHHLRRGCLLCHASAVSYKGRGLTIAGSSGAGKSTMALHLIGHGASFVSNDRVLVKRDGRELSMFGVPKYPRVNPGTMLNNPNLRGLLSSQDQSSLAAMEPSALWTLERKHDVRIDEVFGKDRVSLHSSLNALVLLTWQREQKAFQTELINPRERPTSLRPLIKRPGIFHPRLPNTLDEGPLEERYADLLQSCPVYHITGGGNHAPAVSFCLDLLIR